MAAAVRKRKASSRRRPGRTRRRSHGVLFMLLSSILIVAVIIVSIIVFFKITSIEVTGESRYSSDSIKEASGIELGGNMFILNKFESIRLIEAEFPYLEPVQIKRHLPGTLEIIVSDRLPVAGIETADGLWLIDEEGRLLEKVSAVTFSERGIPRVTGLEPESPEAGNTLQLVEKDKEKPCFDILHTALNNGILFDVEKIEMDKLHQISFTYADRFEVRMGSSQDLEKKLRFFANVLDRLEPGDTGILDISNTDAIHFIPYE